MATVRRQIQKHSDEVVIQTRTLSDWRTYIRRYPWASVAAAAVIGYAIVPRRTKASSDSDFDDYPDDQPQANHLKEVVTGAVKRAAVAQASRALGGVVNGFFTTEDEA